jgi:6,7-dimethyl-8-ribityllumazine synthase
MAHSGKQDYSEAANGLRLAVVAARYNDDIIAMMLQGARQRWAELGGDPERLRVERVPGAFELPLAALKFARSGSVDAVVALGCVIRGDTAHFDFVAGECARGLQQVALDTGVPVSFGVLTTDTVVQAQERASPNEMNKGAEAIDSAVQMARLLRRV